MQDRQLHPPAAEPEEADGVQALRRDLRSYDEYISHPVEERNLGMKVSIVVSKTAKLTGVQGECDKEFNAILKELRQYLRDNGRDQSVADQAEQEYKKMKSDLTSELTGIVYNSAVAAAMAANGSRNTLSISAETDKSRAVQTLHGSAFYVTVHASMLC